MTPDMVNGLFEVIGGTLLFLNAWRIHKDKVVKGVSLLPCLFFTAWGYWNMYFYPAMDAWYSLYGGVVVASANTVWISMVIHYKLYPAKIQEAPRQHGS